MQPNMQRRKFISIISTALAAAWILPLQAMTLVSTLWKKDAFESIKLDEATKKLGASNALQSQQIEIIAPDRAENGAVVQVEITSNIANTESIAILVEHNPTALIGSFSFSNGAMPFVITRIKMAEDSDIKVIVKADGQFFTASKKVVVLENGCG
jgi:sulfur-oxidizing protein SoxY